MRPWRLLLLLACLAVRPALAQAPPLGVGLVPAHVPSQGPADIEQMLQRAAAIGPYAAILARWDDPSTPRTVEQLISLTDRDRLQAIVMLDVFEPGGTRLAPPAGRSQRFDAANTEAYVHTVQAIAAHRPAFLVAAVDANRLLAGGTDRLAEFARAYKQAYRAAKAASPETRVLVGFSFDIFRDVKERGGLQYKDVKALVDLFRPELDALLFSAAPSDQQANPAAIPADALEGISALRDREDLLLSLGWPSAVGGPAAQAAFVDRLPALVERLRPIALLWPLLHDVPGRGPAASLGLFTTEGAEKPAAARFRALRPTQLAAAAPEAAKGTPEPPRRNPADTFRIEAGTLGGAPPTLLASDPKREINHARISPDGTRFVFTRYNRFNPAGEALETNGYLQSEIVICRMDGASCELAIPARRGIVAANASWTPDGRGLLYVTNDRPGRRAGVARLDMATRQVSIIPTGADRDFADPHQVAQTIVASSRAPQDARAGPAVSHLVLYDLASQQRRQLTTPTFAQTVEMDPPLGDHDPKLSPDGTRVAVMRHLAKDDWAIVVVDVATGQERNLSGPSPVDAVPEWSADGRLLLFWSVDRTDLRRSGLYTIRPDGSDRRRVPLPPGRFYTMPAFHPGATSGPDARILFSSRPDARM